MQSCLRLVKSHDWNLDHVRPSIKPLTMVWSSYQHRYSPILIPTDIKVCDFVLLELT